MTISRSGISASSVSGERNIGTPVNPPPIQGVTAIVMMATIVGAWPTDLEPRLQYPNNQQNKIAPLTLTYGQQPPRIFPVQPTTQLAVLPQWQQDWSAQRSPLSVAAQVVPPTVFVPFTRLPWYLTPGPDTPYDVVVVPTGVTIQNGITPPPTQQPAEPFNITSYVAAWTQDWTTQTAPKSLPVTPGDQPPRMRLGNQAIIQANAAWQLDWSTQTAPKAIPVTQGIAIQPTRQYSPAQFSAILSWQQDWNAQRSPVSTVWLPAPTVRVPYAPLPAHLYAAWEPPQPLPTRPVQIAPLTLPTGQQPRPHASVAMFYALITGAWEPPAPMPPAPVMVATTSIPPPTFKPEWANNINVVVEIPLPWQEQR